MMNKLQSLFLALALMPTVATVAQTDVEPEPTAPEDVYVAKNFTESVSTTAWLSEQGNVGNYTGTSPLMREQYQTTTANCEGRVLYQDVEGLENGTYTLELYANASYTEGRGFSSEAANGDLGRTLVVANNVRKTIPVEYQLVVSENKVVTFEGVVVTDGKLSIEMLKNNDGSNWHTIQIKSLVKVSDETTESNETQLAAVDYWGTIKEAVLNNEANANIKGLERASLADAGTASAIESRIARFYRVKPIYEDFAATVAKGVEVGTLTNDDLAIFDGDLPKMAAEDVRVLCWTVKNFIAENVGTYDVTNVLVNPSFESGAADGWTFEKSTDSGVKSATKNPYPMTGSDGAYLFNIWPDGNPLTQKVNLPAGYYRLKAAVATSTGLKVSLFAGNSEGYETETIVDGIADGTGIEASVLFFADGETTIGVKGVGNWYKVDNFRLELVSSSNIQMILMDIENETEASKWSYPSAVLTGDVVKLVYSGDKHVKSVTAKEALLKKAAPAEEEETTYVFTSEDGRTWTLAEMPNSSILVTVEYYEEGSISYEMEAIEKTVGDEVFTNELTLTGDGAVTYKSSDEKVATVNEAGEVTIVGAGEATITATVADGKNYVYNTKEATYTITVVEAVVTNINEKAAAVEAGGWVDLTGKQYTSMPTKKGLYIRNGKLVVVK